MTPASHDKWESVTKARVLVDSHRNNRQIRVHADCARSRARPRVRAGRNVQKCLMRAGTSARGGGRHETAAVHVCVCGGESAAGVVAGARTSRK